MHSLIIMNDLCCTCYKSSHNRSGEWRVESSCRIQ